MMTKKLRLIITCVLLLTVITGAASPVIAHQSVPDTTYISELTGAKVELGDSGVWGFIQTQVYPPSDLREYTAELITMRSETGFASIQFIDTTLDPLDWEESSLEVFASSYSWGEILDSDISSSSSRMLFRGAPFLDIVRVTYSDFQTDESAATSVSLVITGNNGTFIEDLELLLAHVKLDGEPLFPNLDMPEIEAMLNGTSDIQPEPLEYKVTTVEDWEDVGLVSESEWHSTHSSSIITWTNELAFPFHNRIGVTYDQYSGMDRLVLTTPDFKGSVSIAATDHRNASSTGDLHLELTIYGDSGLIGETKSDSHSARLYARDPYYGNERVFIDQFILYVDGTVIWLTIEAQPEDIDSIYHVAIASVSIDGQTVDPAWEPNEINSLLQSQVTGTGNNADVEDDADEEEQNTTTSRSTRTAARTETSSSRWEDWEDMGLVSENDWQSPVNGTSFTWDTTAFEFPSEDADAMKQATLRLLYAHLMAVARSRSEQTTAGMPSMCGTRCCSPMSGSLLSKQTGWMSKFSTRIRMERPQASSISTTPTRVISW